MTKKNHKNPHELTALDRLQQSRRAKGLEDTPDFVELGRKAHAAASNAVDVPEMSADMLRKMRDEMMKPMFFRPPTRGELHRKLMTMLGKVTYKPNFSFSVEGSDDHLMVIISMTVADAVPDTPGRMTLRGPNNTIPITKRCPINGWGNAIFTERFFVEWLRDQIIELERHEINEWLQFDGKHLRDPHPEETTRWRKFYDR